MLDEQFTAYDSGRKNEMEYFYHIFATLKELSISLK